MRLERSSAEAVLTALEALRLHSETGFSLRSGLYTAARRLGTEVAALRLARRLLHLYSIRRRAVRAVLEEILGGAQVSELGRRLMELLILAAMENLNLGKPESFALSLRSLMSKEWPVEVEPYLGVLRSLPLTSIEYKVENYPRWYRRYVSRLLGRYDALRLLRFQDEEKPPIYLSLNTLLLPKEKILEHLERRGVEVVEDGRLPGIFLAKRTKRIGELNQLARGGMLSIHDFSSFYAVAVLDVKPGDLVLDLCAAPGTKTWLAAKLMRNKGRIIAVDSSISRLQAHLRRIRRMGVKVVEDIVADITYPLPLKIEADKVLVDPPCSSTGLFWREPSYRWSVRPRHVRMFARLQAKMLDRASRHVRRGGTLLYSTCSITLEENEMVVEDFLKTHPEYALVEVEPRIGADGMRGMPECRRLYPHRDRCNGFFLAKLLRRW